MRKIISLLLILTANFYCSVAISSDAESISRDSMRTKWANGKKFLMHKVAKGETFYSIARDYKVDVKELMNANKGVTTLKTGQIVQVPVAENYTGSTPQTEENVNTQEQTTEEEARPSTEQQQAESTGKNVYHTVKKGETLSSISRKYNVPVATISDWNGLKNNQVNAGQKLIVKKQEASGLNKNTAEQDVIAKSKSATEEDQRRSTEYDHHYGTKTINHTVKKGETLFGIAKQYGVSAKDLTTWNQLQSSNVKIGQKLIVNKIDPNAPPKESVRSKAANENELDAPKTAEVERKVNDVIEIAGSETAVEKSNGEDRMVEEIPATVNTTVIDKAPSGKNIKQSIETGEAAWVNDADLNPNKYFALHRTAPIGTIMKVTNRMNGKYVFVKVIGKLPGTGDNEKLIIKISKAAADRLGVIDPTFQCELNYAFASE